MRGRLKPYRQGALDGLCGVHAIINALRALCPEMTEKEARKLFRVLVKSAVRKGALKVIWRGMDWTVFEHLLVLAVARMARERGPIIKVARPFAAGSVELPRFVSTLRHALNGHRVAIASIHVEQWHWTVITRATEKSLFLLDSVGMNFIRIESCGLRKSQQRYRILARELLILSVGAREKTDGSDEPHARARHR